MSARSEHARGNGTARTTSFVVALVSALIVLPTAALADRDSEYWSQVRVTGAVNEAVAFTSTVALRHDEDVSRHYYTRMESGVSWSALKYVTAGAEYAHLNTGSSDRWALECRPSVSLTLKWSPGALSLSDRSRLERRIKEKASSTRYRNRLTLKGPKLTPLGLRPYAEGEIFYDLTSERLEKRRVSGGVAVELWRPIGVSVYYTLEGRRPRSEWTDVDVFGTTLTYSF